MNFAIKVLPFLLLLSCTTEHGLKTPSFKTNLEEQLFDPQLKKLSNANIEYASNVLLLLPLSHNNKDMGQDILNACLLLANQNKGMNVNFLVVDSAKNINEWQEEIKNKKIAAIIGPVFSNEAKQIGVLFPDVPIFSLSNNPEINNNHIFACGVPPQQELRALVKYMCANHSDDLIIFASDCDFCNRMIRYIKSQFSANKRNPDNIITIIYDKISAREATDIINSYGKKSVLILDPALKLKNTRGLKIFTLSSIAISDPEAWDNSIFAYEHNEAQESFVNTYKRIYKTSPGILSIIAYDIGKAIIEGIEFSYVHSEEEDEKFPASLYSHGYEGCLGEFFIKPKRGIRRPLGIFKLENLQKIRISKHKY